MSEEVLFVQVEPTTRCNFSCRFCAGRHLPQRDMGLDLFETVLRLFPGLQYLELQGEGEPLLHPGFFEMARLTKDLRPAAQISTITNGSLISPQNIVRILDAGLSAIMISMESADAAVFHELRGGRLETIVAGTRALMAARRSRGAVRPAVGLAVTILRRTRGEMPGLIALYESLGLDGGFVVQPLESMKAYTRYYNSETAAEVLSPQDMEEFSRTVAQNRGVVNVLRRPVAAIGFYARLFAGWEPRSGTCPWLAKAPYVSADGCATSCCYQKDPTINRFGVIGQVSIDELTENRRKLAEGLQQGKPGAGCAIARLPGKSSLPLPPRPAAPARRRQRPCSRTCLSSWQAVCR